MMTYFDMSQLSRGAEAIGRMVQDREERVAALEHALDAALARAEAAEAERNELRERHDSLKKAYANLVEEAAGRLVRRLVRMYAAERRVVKLEAQLAAQGWRPVTEDWPPSNIIVPVQMRDGSIRWGHRYGDLWNLTGGRYSIGDVTHAYELPPAPQEPTP